MTNRQLAARVSAWDRGPLARVCLLVVGMVLPAGITPSVVRSRQRPDLSGPDDEKLVWILVANDIWKRVRFDDEISFVSTSNRMSEGQRAIFATSRLDGHVCPQFVA